MDADAPPRRTSGALARTTIAGYAIGSLATGGFSTLPGLVLVYYLTDTLAVPALAAGVLVGAAKVWDVLIDPVIGGSSDRDLVRTGSRRRGMLAGAIALPFLFALTFAVPASLTPAASGVWVLVAFVLTATAFSLFQVPYIALPAELANGYDQRTRLLTWRVVVLTFAILLFGAGGPTLRSLGADERQGYLLMAIIAGVVLAVGMLLSIVVVPRSAIVVSTVRPQPTGQRGRRALVADGYRAGIGALRRSQPFRALLLTFALQALATGMMLAGAQYVATWVLRSEDAVTFLFLALIAPALVFTPIWGVVARRIGKERGFAIASVVFGIAALSLTGLAWAPGDWAYLPVAVAGAAYAGMQALPMAMLPDVISSDARVNGDGAAGAFGGIWTAGETTGAALGATVLTLVLAISGYAESAAGQTVVQSPQAVLGIVVSFSVVPAVLIAASLLVLRRYRVRRSDVDAIIPIPSVEGLL